MLLQRSKFRVVICSLRSTPPLVRPRRNVAIAFSTVKTGVEWCGYSVVKQFDDISNRFDTIPVCDRQTGGQTDTDILRQHYPRVKDFANLLASALLDNDGLFYSTL